MGPKAFIRLQENSAIPKERFDNNDYQDLDRKYTTKEAMANIQQKHNHEHREDTEGEEEPSESGSSITNFNGPIAPD